MYYVPKNQKACAGKAHAMAEAFWKQGVFLWTSDEFIYARIREYKDRGIPLPGWEYDFSFGGMGIADEGIPVQVPNHIYDLQCPVCKAEIWLDACSIWNEEE